MTERLWSSHPVSRMLANVSANSEERMWILVGIVVGLVAIGVVLAAAVIAHRRGDTTLASEMTADQWLTLGIVFAGAGAALTATIGVWMIGMVVLGIVYLGIGIWMKRNRRGGQTNSRVP